MNEGNKNTKRENSKIQKKLKNKKDQIEKLQELRKKASQLEKKISRQKFENFKQLNIRNLKIFSNTCNFIAPFVISTGLTVGVFALLGGGTPFHSDDVVKYKLYNLNHKTNNYTYIKETYQTNIITDDELPKSQLIVYTPWIDMGEKYMRYKKEYKVDDSCILDLFDAVLKDDYTYITNYIKDYKEEIQIANSIEEIENNNYIIEANLIFFDKEDVLRYKESDLKNFVITIIELVLGLGIGGFAAYERNFNYWFKLKFVNSEYHLNIKAIKPMKQELKAINEKILSLSKKKGGK